jgi:hypothetical protein
MLLGKNHDEAIEFKGVKCPAPLPQVDEIKIEAAPL